MVFAEGEFFAVDRIDHRGMSDPSLFTFADGTIGVIATRVLQDGGADGTQTSSALVFKAKDAAATDFEELGLLDLGTTSGVVQPRAVYDTDRKRYVVSWTDSTGAARSTTVDDLARTELRTASVAAGSITVTSTTAVDGKTFTTETTAPYAARSCR